MSPSLSTRGKTAAITAPMSQVDTPALLVDANRLEKNIAFMAAILRNSGVALRPHTKTHKSPIIAGMQIAAGARGVCCAKLSEAEMLVDGGIRDILVTTPVVGSLKAQRAARLATRCHLLAVVDSLAQIKTLAEAVTSAGVELELLVEIDVGQARCGLPADPAVVVPLVRTIVPPLRFLGLQGYQGSLQMLPNYADRVAGVAAAMDKLELIATALREAGFAPSVLTGGGTGTLKADLTRQLLTEVQPGSYVFMDHSYCAIDWAGDGRPPPFATALTVLTTVVSHNALGHFIVDAGLKAINNDVGVPKVKGRDDLVYSFSGDEHGRITPSGPVSNLFVGDTLELLPAHCDTTVGLYDYCYVIRDGGVEDKWTIPARGKTQ